MFQYKEGTMDFWHRVGRIIRFSNIGTLIFFILNMLFIVAAVGQNSSMWEIAALYFITVIISLSPVGEWLLCFLAGTEDIKRKDMQLRIIPLMQLVLDKARESSCCQVKFVKLKIVHDCAPNAFAIGRNTICVTEGLLEMPDELILGVLAHETGHLAYGHTALQLLIGGGNLFITGFLLLLKVITITITALFGLISLGMKNTAMGIITVTISMMASALLWVWTKVCKVFLMWSMRQNEFIADEYAMKLGFGYELATVIDKHMCGIPRKGLFNALYNTHPYHDDRIAALQKLGVNYSRYEYNY